MKNIKVFLIAAFVLVVIIAVVVSYNKKSDENNVDSQNPVLNPSPSLGNDAPAKAPSPAPQTPSYTLAQVQAHADASSCWTIIGDNVYDLTPWINQHPGGAENILKLCGKDGTAAFTGKHGGQEKQENTLAGFKIGDYKR